MQVRVNPEAAFREVGGEIFVVTADRTFHHLGPATSVEIFKFCRACARSEAEIVGRIVALFDVDEATAAMDVQRFVTQLVERDVFVSQ